MRKIKYLFSVLCVLCFAMSAEAQTQSGFGETMRSSGRIYVVIAVMLTILAGLILYLVRLDRKITRLEKETI